MDKSSFVSVAIALVIMIVFGVMVFGSSSSESRIANAVGENFQIKDVEGQVVKYHSPYNVQTTADKITSFSKPHDKKINSSDVSVLLYSDASIFLKAEDDGTEIELIRDHQRAYNRHRHVLVGYWGPNVYRRGRLGSPRSFRSGSIGSSSGGGGFGFGK
ncbi:MAG: DUF4247 domain-containing protein [Bacillota bacterium]